MHDYPNPSVDNTPTTPSPGDGGDVATTDGHQYPTFACQQRRSVLPVQHIDASGASEFFFSFLVFFYKKNNYSAATTDN